MHPPKDRMLTFEKTVSIVGAMTRQMAPFNLKDWAIHGNRGEGGLTRSSRWLRLRGAARLRNRE
jgi:hypothetical protein